MTAACPTMTFEGITQREWDCVRGEARRRGVPFPEGNDGSVSAHGASADYRWTPDVSRLTVTFTQKPDWVDCPTIERELRQAVRVCGGQ